MVDGRAHGLFDQGRQVVDELLPTFALVALPLELAGQVVELEGKPVKALLDRPGTCRGEPAVRGDRSRRHGPHSSSVSLPAIDIKGSNGSCFPGSSRFQ